jgi:hypothetical protein
MQYSARSASRRRFLASMSLAGAGVAAGFHRGAARAEDKPSETPLIERIEREVIFPGRERGPSWFHPRACVVPDGNERKILMTLQTIGGSDVFGPVHWTLSSDLGRSWSDPAPIPGLDRRTVEGNLEEGTCDVVPEYHPNTRTVLAMGHNVYYRKGALARPQGSRWPVYTVRDGDGAWSALQKLEWDDPRGAFIYTSNCSQRVTLANGDILVPLSFGSEEAAPRSATSVRCSFDGRTLAVREAGNELTNQVGRGLLEPSLAALDGRYYMTIRAEDQRGYVTASDDGLHWQKQQPWMWDDGEPLTMSTTQQRWLVHPSALLLVYTRKDATNASVTRWRAPLYVAEVDRRTLRLVRDSERVVLPLLGDAVNDPKRVALMGNFHTVAVSPKESWVTVGENRPGVWKGNTLLARIVWRG